MHACILAVEDQKKTVERILRANRNRPSESSVKYFLENTLEYLQKREPNLLKRWRFDGLVVGDDEAMHEEVMK